LPRARPVVIDLVASDETSNLHYREADIAVRMYRPTQLDLVILHLGELEVSAFASKKYVERRGLPRSRESWSFTMSWRWIVGRRSSKGFGSRGSSSTRTPSV
jgi:hypothetical protein